MGLLHTEKAKPRSEYKYLPVLCRFCEPDGAILPSKTGDPKSVQETHETLMKARPPWLPVLCAMPLFLAFFLPLAHLRSICICPLCPPLPPTCMRNQGRFR